MVLFLLSTIISLKSSDVLKEQALRDRLTTFACNITPPTSGSFESSSILSKQWNPTCAFYCNQNPGYLS